MKRFLPIAVLLTVLLLSLFAVKKISGQPIVVSGREQQIKSSVIFILDAGHGGEDGGAVAPDGTVEKDLNLQIERTLADLFTLYGIPFKETRTDDGSLGDQSLATVRERKRSDILTRYQIVNQTPGGVLLSIHQNQFQQPQYGGTQVFYSAGHPQAKALAQMIQSSVIETLQPNNKRQIKASGSSIFLLYKAQRPSVLIECGFLSNPEELQLLKNRTYDTELSYAILRAVLQYCNDSKGEAAV